MKFCFVVTGKGDFRVHREGCRDIKRERFRNNNEYLVEAESAMEAVADEARAYAEQGQGGFDFTILPCAK